MLWQPLQSRLPPCYKQLHTQQHTNTATHLELRNQLLQALRGPRVPHDRPLVICSCDLGLRPQAGDERRERAVGGGLQRPCANKITAGRGGGGLRYRFDGLLVRLCA